jgi:hypothetical protein
MSTKGNALCVDLSSNNIADLESGESGKASMYTNILFEALNSIEGHDTLEINLKGNDPKGHFAEQALNRKWTVAEIKKQFEASGHGTSALAGGAFKSKDVKTDWEKFGLLASIATGYIDLGLDLQVTVNWFNEGKHELFALSVAAMLLPILIQWMFIDKSLSRGAQSFFQVKLAFDGWNSLKEGTVTPEFAAAKFAEGVYEASAEGILQTYDALNVLAETGTIDQSLLISVFFSLYSMANVLLLFIDGWQDGGDASLTDEERAEIGHKPFCKMKKVKKLRVWLYHVTEVGFRILSFAMLGFALNSLSFLVALFSLAIRFLLYWYCVPDEDSKTRNTMSKSMVVASVLVDSVWDSKKCLAAASTCTAIEGAAFAFVAYSKCSDFPGNGREVIFIILAAFFLVKSVLQVCYIMPMADRGSVEADDMEDAGKGVFKDAAAEEAENAVGEVVRFDSIEHFFKDITEHRETPRKRDKQSRKNRFWKKKCHCC